MNYFVTKNGQQLGPFSESDIKAKLASREFSPQDYVWWEGQADWKPISAALAGAGAGPAMPPPPGSPTKTSGLAIASLVCGVMGVGLSFLTGIPAIIMGHISLGRIKRDPQLGGYGIALAGTILGYVTGLLFPLISIVAISVLIALGNQVKETFKEINTAQAPADTTSSDTNSSDTNSTTTNAPATNSPSGQ